MLGEIVVKIVSRGGASNTVIRTIAREGKKVMAPIGKDVIFENIKNLVWMSFNKKVH